VILVIRLGWSVGLIRTFFAVFSGFMAIFVSTKYSCQESLKFYIIFAITALFIIMLGALTLRIISFFYLNVLDRLGGALLSVCVWLIISVNILIPTMTYGTTYTLNKSTSIIYATISNIIQSKIPIFTNWVPLKTP
jgi:hypothetical protein